MTDFTRENMRERIARALWAQEHRHTNRAVFEDNSQPYFEDAEALMHELGLWEAHEAIRDQRWAIRKLLAADEALELCEDLKGDLQMERRHAVQDCEDAVALAEESLARLRGETK